MKLKLRIENDIQILSVSELDNPGNIEVLRAGLTKILKAGKNRIVLEIAGASSVPAEILRELGRFRLLANELAGDILLAGMDAATKARIDQFSKPPFIQSFETTEQALRFFKELSAPKGPKPAPATKPTPEPGAAAKEFKEQIVQREKGELGTLRKEVERLRAENTSLTDLLSARIHGRRNPPDTQAYREKIEFLEKQLAGFLEKPPEKAK